MPEGSVNVVVDTSNVAQVVAKLGNNIDRIGNQIENLNAQIHSDMNAVYGKLDDVDKGIDVLKEEMMAQMALQLLQMQQVKNEIVKMIETSAQTEVMGIISEKVGQDISLNMAGKQIDEQYTKATQRQMDIIIKFTKLDEQLVRSYYTDIKRIANHIIDIWEKQYHRAIEPKIAKFHTEFHHTLLKSIQKIRELREHAIGRLMEDTQKKYQNFVEIREKFKDTVKSKIADGLSAAEGEIGIPLYIIEQNGSQKLLSNAELIETNDPVLSLAINETDYFKSIKEKATEIQTRVRWRQMSAEELKKMNAGFDTLQSKGLISEEYASALKRLLETAPPLIAA